MPERLDLAERILTHRGIQHEDDIVRRVGVQLARNAHDLFQFCHQFGPVLEATGRIDEHEIEILAFRPFNGLVDKAGGICARRL